MSQRHEDGAIVWLTGLSGSGKTSIACCIQDLANEVGQRAVILDGDVLRQGLSRDLGFSPADRSENLRRTAEVARLCAAEGLLVVVALISPYAVDRSQARAIAAPYRFVEVHVATPLSVCKARDPKGLYGRAERGEIAEFTGISSPYEVPDEPALRVAEDGATALQCAQAIWNYLHTQAN